MKETNNLTILWELGVFRLQFNATKYPKKKIIIQ